MSTPAPYTEDQAIVILKQLEKRWPDTLWLFATGNGLHVMQRNEKGEQAMRGGYDPGVDPDYEIDCLNIPNDGGDW